MSAIADQLGVSAPALYWHFASKEAMLFAILEGALEEFLVAIEPNVAPPAEQITVLVRRYVFFQLGRRQDVEKFSSLLWIAQLGHVLTDDHQERLSSMQRRVYDIFRRCLDRGVADGVFAVDEPTVTAFAMITMCEHVNTWARPGGRLAAADIAEEYVRLATRMVGLPASRVIGPSPP